MANSDKAEQRAEAREARAEAKAAQRDAIAEARAAEREAKAQQQVERRLEAEEERTGSRRRSTLKTVAVVSGRSVIGLVGIAATLVILGAVAVIPWPSWGVAAPVSKIDPTAENQTLVCNGPMLTVGASAQAKNISSLGSATVLSSGGSASTLTSGNPNASQDGLPQVFTADANAAQLAASESQAITLDSYAGLVAAACTAPTSDSWLIGGQTTLGYTQVLLLGNPSTVNALVNVEVYGSTGKISTLGLGDISVAPGAQVTIPLAGYAPNEVSPVVHVTSSGGRVSASINTTQITGVTPIGAEIIDPSASPAKQAVIPGVVVDASVGSAETGAGADGAATLRLLATTAASTASVSVTGENGAPGAVFSVNLTPGTVASLPLTGLAAGSYTVTVKADQAFVAAAQSALTANGVTDFAWFASANSLADQATIAVPSAGTLHLANPTTAAVTVALSGPSAKQVVVPAGASTSIALDAGVWRASAAAGLFASVSLQGVGQLASFAVPGANNNPDAVSVYTR